MHSSAAPRHRPFQFRLRTVFVVVTVLAVAVGGYSWRLRISRDRQAMREWIESHEGEV